MDAPHLPLDPALLKKYDIPGPRYTSYPTAPLFTGSFTGDEFLAALESSNMSASAGDVSLYFHFPFCDTLCYFCGCTMQVTRDQNRVKEYLSYLKKEIGVVSRAIHPDRRVTQLHWGGGTPTHLLPEDILDIGGCIASKFRFDPEAEMSVEVDPRELTQRHLGTLRHLGFNRVSIGVQDFNEKVQRAVNRIQPAEVITKAFKWVEALGFESVNVDLIYGLPFQTLASFRETLGETIQYVPDRIAVFNYAHVPWLKPHQRLIHPEDLPGPDEKLEILGMTMEFLTANGYEYIGMDHFARPNDELSVARRKGTLHRNFQGYSTRAGADLYGLGPSAISFFGNVYAQNAKTLSAYYAALDAGRPATSVGYRMSRDDVIRRHVIMRLMCDLLVDKRDIEQRFGIIFDRYFERSIEKLQPLVDEGIVVSGPGSIRVVWPGHLVLRNIAMCFDAYLDSQRTAAPLFSRTV